MRLGIQRIWTQFRRLWRPAITGVFVLAASSRCIEWKQPTEAVDNGISHYVAAVQTLAGDANAVLKSGTAPAAGNFSNYTATYTGLAGDVGKTIGIQLSATQSQGDFDNVRLNDSTASAPEPGTAFLGVLGLAAMLPVVRMRLHKRG